MFKVKTKKDWLIIVITGIASLLLLAKVTHIAWRFLAPKATTAIKVEQLDYKTGLSWATNFFGAEPATAAGAKPAVTADVKVFGIISGKNDSAAYALLLVDGQRRELFGIGEEVVPGLKLIEITPFHIVLENGSIQTTIEILEEKSDQTIVKSAQENNQTSAAKPSTSELIMPGNATRAERMRAAREKAASNPAASAQPGLNVAPANPADAPSQKPPQTVDQSRPPARSETAAPVELDARG